VVTQAETLTKSLRNLFAFSGSKVMQKAAFQKICGATVLAIATSWAVSGFLISGLGTNFYTDVPFSDMGSLTFKLIPIMIATIIGGSVAAFLCEYKWLPAILIAVCMTVQLYDRSATLGLTLPNSRYVGAIIMLFINASFGQSLTRVAEVHEIHR
jgi:hypothetical protein